MSYRQPSPERVQEAVDLALASGLLMADTHTSFTHAPFTAFPSPYPRTAYNKALAVAIDFNQLMIRVAMDHDFLARVTHDIASADPFTARLFNSYLETRPVDGALPPGLGLFRSDYLLQASAATSGDWGNALRQVEINTISSAFGALSSRLSELHHYLAARHGDIDSQALPSNPAQSGMVDALASAWRHYGEADAVILFVIQADERNIFDQRHMEHMLWTRHGIAVVRRTLAQISEHACLSSDSQRLRIENQEVALVYFRAGYTPGDYDDECAWQGRVLLERSIAIKCPTLAMQLCGTKKMQQCLAEPNVLEQFFDDKQQCQRLRSCFAGLYKLDDREAVDRALMSPENYVLKPQREGGGNNLYGQDMRRALAAMDESKFPGWILMEYIRPPRSSNFLIRDRQCSAEIPTVSELGIFSMCLNQGDTLLENRALGHLLRTKPETEKEGGIVARAAVLDSPCLVD